MIELFMDYLISLQINLNTTTLKTFVTKLTEINLKYVDKLKSLIGIKQETRR